MNYQYILSVLDQCIENADTPEVSNTKTTRNFDPLPSWNDGDTKTATLDYINTVTKEAEQFTSISKHIAVFDNDGNF